MPRLRLAATVLAEWYDLVQEAERHCGKKLADELENYLVHLLQSFMTKPEIANSVLGEEYLQSQQLQGTQQIEELRKVGDKCLLFSGLFPERAEKCNVEVSYFVELGQCAYHTLWLRQLNQTRMAELFHRLEKEFVALMDTLHGIRELRGDLKLSALQAEDLWRNTHSQHALQILREYSSGSIITASDVSQKKLH